MGTMKLHLAIAGEKIVIAGLSLQVATFIVYLIASIDFHRRINRKTKTNSAENLSDEWKRLLRILYIVSALILFRCLFRLIEYAMGNAAYLIAHEWTLYVFDAVPMFLVLVLLLVLQPTKYVSLEAKKNEIEEAVEAGLVETK